MRTATVTATTTALLGSGRGGHLDPGVYEIVEIDGAAARGEMFVEDPHRGQLVCADPDDPNITIEGER